MSTSTEVTDWKTVEERKCLGYLRSDQTRGEVTSCKCVGWGVVDCQLAAIAPDMMQRSPPWPLHRWRSLLFLAYIEKKKKKTIGPTNHLCVATLITLSELTFCLVNKPLQLLL